MHDLQHRAALVDSGRPLLEDLDRRWQRAARFVSIGTFQEIEAVRQQADLDSLSVPAGRSLVHRLTQLLRRGSDLAGGVDGVSVRPRLVQERCLTLRCRRRAFGRDFGYTRSRVEGWRA